VRFRDAGFDARPEEIVPSDKDLGSRNKAKMAVGGTSRKPTLGIVNADYSISDISDCPLHIQPIPGLLPAIRELISQHSLAPYDIKARTGEIKYVIVRASETTGECMLRLVLRSREQLKAAENLLREAQEKFPAIIVASINLQPVPQAIIEGPEEIQVSDRDYMVDVLAEKKIVFSAQSFSQVTSNVAAKLYLAAAEIVKKARPKTLLDLFCGVGAFSLFCAPWVERGVGVELSERAISNAQRGFELNGLSNFEFIADDAEKFLERFKQSLDCIIVNPPRRGLSPVLVRDIVRLAPETLLYSSCYPESLLRDLRALSNQYAIERILPFDMFPLTGHVETLVSLAKIR
jgi:23S rRNA (uracil747-C5)-methyltransferase